MLGCRSGLTTKFWRTVRGTCTSLQGSQREDGRASSVDADEQRDGCFCNWPKDWSSSALLSQTSLESWMILISLSSICLNTHDGTWIGFSSVERSSSP